MNHRNVSKALILFSVVSVGLISLFPFKFSLENTALSWKLFALSSGQEIDWEIVVNVLLYFPMGFGITQYFGSKGWGNVKVVTSILLSCLVLSYCFETLQSFLPTRFPSWRDVASNVLGGILGFLCIFVWAKKRVSLFLYVYLVIIFLISIPMQTATTLKNWNASYPLTLGNEHTGDRPWQGLVSEFYVASRAANAQEVHELFVDKSPRRTLTDSLVAYYKSKDSSGYYDEVGSSPPLLIKARTPGWFETPEPASYLTNLLASSSQFTLGAIVISQNTNQRGPARIISLSTNGNERNFTLGQAGEDLVFRLRTPLTGLNGNRPDLRVPSVFSSSNARHIVVTYDARNLFVYVDGLKSPYFFELTPGLLAYNFLSRNDLPRSRTADVLYYCAIFLPLGVMVLLALNEAKPSSEVRVILSGALILLLISLALEGLFVFVSGRQEHGGNVLLGVVFSFFSFLAVYGLTRTRVLLTHWA